MTHFTSFVAVLSSFVFVGCGITTVDSDTPTPAPSGTVAVVPITEPAPVPGIKPAPACEPTVSVNLWGQSTATISAGTSDYAVGALTVLASCKDLEVKSIGLMFVSLGDSPEDKTPFCSGSCAAPEDWNFRNLRLRDYWSASTLMGPIGLKETASNQPAHARFADSIFLKAGESQMISIVLDVANPLPANPAGKKYHIFVTGVDAGPGTAVNVIHSSDPGGFSIL